MRRYFCCLLLFLPLLSSVAWAWQARAKNAHDGDSITVINESGTQIHIRLYGIDAPELKQPYGYQARRRMTKLAGRKTLDIEPVDTDRYGRTVAIVRLRDGTMVNEVMVAEGLAWVYDDYCHSPELCQRLRELQDQARQERRGLWVDDAPQRPSDWRRETKTEEWYKKPVRVMKAIARKVRVIIRP
jgi:endonuclease YncB( thermonuclease family)